MIQRDNEREKKEKEAEEVQAREEIQMREFQKNMAPPTIMAIPFLALNHYDRLFMVLYMVIAIALLAYKHTVYPLPGYAVACQSIILAMLALTQLLRYSLAQRGVSEKQGRWVVLYIVMTLFVVASFAFELRLQTYVVMAELITNSIGLSFTVCQIISAIWVTKVLMHKKSR